MKSYTQSKISISGISRKKSWLWIVCPQDPDSMDYWHPAHTCKVISSSVTVRFNHASDEKGVCGTLYVAMAE
eukprot:9645381-Ditylum_brightwellii.AAC.1